MTITLIEGAVDALDTYLEANMAAKVVELNARYADDVTLEDIADWYIGSYPLAVPKTPSVALVGIDWTPSEQRKANIAGVTRVDIAVFVGGNELTPRFRALARYAVGLVEMLKAGKSSIGYESVQLAGPIALTDIMDTPDFTQAVIVPAALGLLEEY
jgi:hypothetical protein